MSKLEELGLTRDDTMGGEIAEFEVVKPKLVGEKREFLSKAVVDKVVEAYAADLRAAYIEEERLVTDVQQRDVRIAELEAEIAQLSNDIRRAEGFGAQMTQVEEMMDSLENSVNDFSIQHQKDTTRIKELETRLQTESQTISQLQSELNVSKSTIEDMTDQVQEMEAERESRGAEFKSLETDVNDVLETLRIELANLGVEI